MKLLLKRLLSRYPSKLPVGMTEFNIWCDSIIELSGPFADRDSMVFAIASTLIHADAKHGKLPKSYFVDRLRKAAANQIASQAFQDIKIKQAEAAAKAKAEQEAAQQLKTNEATPVSESVAPNVQAN